LAGVHAELTKGASLAEQVPALIELDLNLGQPAPVVFVEGFAHMTGARNG
jgi:hypothetical protein